MIEDNKLARFKNTNYQGFEPIEDVVIIHIPPLPERGKLTPYVAVSGLIAAVGLVLLATAGVYVLWVVNVAIKDFWK